MTDPTRRALRTFAQVCCALLAAAPLLAGEPAVQDLPVLAGAAALAAALSRAMSAPAVQRLLPPWLCLPAGQPPAPGRPAEEEVPS
ncbi:hypothetical protein [Streptomyces cyaneofuscatus]|uniref:hypothetical protein n=1 Tax=Streptomyces cyaneofuscatus TaxID=66883 RepID=UPI00378F1A55|nr:hypothetical protein OG973_13740 [Streptomyces cyaneofuscatus]